MSQIGKINPTSIDKWFTVKKDPSGGMGFASPKKEFLEYLQKSRNKNVDSYVSGNASAVRSVADLTSAELQDWSAKYDPQKMTQEEYVAFIDDLISSRVLSEGDKNLIGYSNMVCVGTVDTLHQSFGSYIIPAGEKTLITLADADGNAMKWAKHRSAWEVLVSESGQRNMAIERSTKLFGKLSSIMEQMISKQE